MSTLLEPGSTPVLVREVETAADTKLAPRGESARSPGLWHAMAPRALEILAFVIVAALALYVHGKGMTRFPGPLNDDEGTYVAQAWAVMTGLGPHHGLSQYTYWYDHPPAGWIQIAIGAFFTGVFHPGALQTVQSGREFMLVYFAADLVLVYYIARRLRLGISASLFAIVVLGFSPLVVLQLRLVMLDTIAVTWLMLSYALILGKRYPLPRMSLGGIAFGISVLSKETFLLFLPMLALAVWFKSAGRTRKFYFVAYLGSAFMVGSTYLIYAALRGELLPGAHHVSLIGTAIWQVYSRPGTGSIFNSGSRSFAIASGWLTQDPYLFAAGAVGLFACVARRELRPIALGLITGLAALARPGYLPAAFLTGYIPLIVLSAAGALSVAGSLSATVMDGLRSSWQSRGTRTSDAPRRIRVLWKHPTAAATANNAKSGRAQSLARRHIAKVVSVLIWTAFGVTVVPSWTAADANMMSKNQMATQLAAEKWIISNIPRHDAIMVDDYYWLDLVLNGYQRNKVVWDWKFGVDPEVDRRFPAGWKDLNYLIATNGVRGAAVQTLYDKGKYQIPIRHSIVVKTFGSGITEVSILKVVP